MFSGAAAATTNQPCRQCYATREIKLTIESCHYTTVIELRVQPNAAKNEVVEFSNGVFRVRVAAPPVKGKANKELVAFLSKALDLGRDSLTIVKGHTSHNKVIAVAGLSQEEVVKRLTPKPSSSGGDATRQSKE